MIAAFCGIIIGYERKSKAKVAGVRTHCVVACASALMMVISQYAYVDVMEQYGEFVKLDPSRVASGVVSGIGFLGAGMIFVHKKTVTGLTTAAGIWATSGIGMAIGAGMYLLGISASVIIVIIQLVLHMTPPHFRKNALMRPELIEKQEELRLVQEALRESGIQVLSARSAVDEEQQQSQAVYTVTVAMPKSEKTKTEV